MTGKVLGNRYQIGDRLGGGGMAVVYKARDHQLGRDVAVKVLRGHFQSDEDFVRRFRREATSAASLSHPNVVQIFDVGQEDDIYYIVLELVEGQSLKEVIQATGPLPIEQACRIALEILSALAHAHENRIVHRDIKPHNILISREGRAKVTDFGIARATSTDTVTHTGSIMGSAHYFSPEQANGQVTAEKSDIYSLGIVLYEMITGSLPFQGESPIAVALKHLRDKPVPPSRLNNEIPRELDALVLKALEKEPEDRFTSAGDMSGALRKFLDDHAAGRTHMAGDFPTMDLRAMKNLNLRREIAEVEDEPIRPAAPRSQRAQTPPPRKGVPGWIWVILVALVVVTGLGAGVWALIGFLDVPDVTVPDVTQMPVREAQRRLAESKLDNIIQSEQFSQLKPNYVISTDPPAGTPVKQNRKVGLVISKGADAKQLPNVIGRTEEDARAVLETERFVVGQVTPKTSSEDAGKVIEQFPPAGTALTVGSSVNLVVSSGPLRVPAIVGKSLNDARSLLAQAGLTEGRLEARADLTRPKDQVIGSDPASGARVMPGTAVNLIVSQGPAGTLGKPFSKVLTVPGDAAKQYAFKVTLVDTIIAGVPTESAPLVNEVRRGGERVTVSGTYFGEAYLRIFEENIEVQRIPLP